MARNISGGGNVNDSNNGVKKWETVTFSWCDNKGGGDSGGGRRRRFRQWWSGWKLWKRTNKGNTWEMEGTMSKIMIEWAYLEDGVTIVEDGEGRRAGE